MANTRDFEELKAGLKSADAKAREILRCLMNGQQDVPEPYLIDSEEMKRLESRLKALAEAIKVKPPAEYEFHSRANKYWDGPELFYCRMRTNLQACHFWLTDNSVLADDC